VIDLDNDFDGLPLAISWELTLECNLRCNHCGSSAGSPRTKELSLSEALFICDQFPDLFVREIDFTGGEPLMSRNFFPIAEYLQKRGILTQLITNGLMLKRNLVAKIKEAGIASVGISLDGLRATHDSIRGCIGLFKQVMLAIKYLHEFNIPLTVITTVNQLNLEQLPSLLEILLKAQVKRWQIQPTFPLGRSQDNKKLLLNKQQYLKLGLLIQSLWSKAVNEDLKIDLADSYGYFTEFDPRNPRWRGCPAGLVTCGITSEGKIKGCLSLPDEKTEGDLRKDQLWDIWFDPGSFSYNRNFSAKDAGANCQSCDQIENCKGGCSAMSYGSTKHFHNNPFCFYKIEREELKSALSTTNPLPNS
jgi:radical SAM protein with 4Fe4S-binding SPASM domain